MTLLTRTPGVLSAFPRGFRFLPFEVLTDNTDGKGFVLEGVDVHGAPFGVGEGTTMEHALEALAAHVLDALLAAAKTGEDYRRDLWTAARLATNDTLKDSPFLPFSPRMLFPVALRLARVHADLTQAALARLLNVSQQAIHKLESPGANPKLETVEDLSLVLGLDLLKTRPERPLDLDALARAEHGVFS